MFENIIGQKSTIDALTRQLLNRTMPKTLILHGPEYAGKLTTALELARALTCRETAKWNCSCRSCSLNRELLHPSVQLVGSRYFAQEIITSAETVKRSDTAASAFLFIRAVRKLLRRLDTVQWENEEKRIQKALEHLSETEDALEPFVHTLREGHTIADPEARATATDRVVKAALKTIASLPGELVPVAVIRNLQSWVHNTTDEPRIIIIENVDRLGEASRNALLKVLEEPPAESYFVLTTARVGAVIATIRSRARSYALHERTRQETDSVIHRIFKGPEFSTGGIREWFLEHEYPGTGSLRSHAEYFITQVLDPDAHRSEPAAHEQVKAALEGVPEREGYRHFLQELLGLCSSILREEERRQRFALSIQHIEQWKEAIHTHYLRADALNISTALLLESLYIEMRDVGHGYSQPDGNRKEQLLR
ncbi:MAG: hypothetical protein ACLFNQ_08450 [Spirochaetaceae bacterium]